MSSDLLAEFDSFYRPPNDASKTATPASNDLSFLVDTKQSGSAGIPTSSSQWNSFSPQPTQSAWPNMAVPSGGSVAKPAPASDDIWGSFEADTQSTSYQRPVVPTNSRAAAVTHNSQSKPGILRRPTLDMFSRSTFEIPVPSVKKGNSNWTPQPPSKPVGKNDTSGDILFDAMDELSAQPEDDDEFGDFETGASIEPPETIPQTQTADLLFDSITRSSKATEPPVKVSSLSISFPTGALPYPQAPKSPSFQERNPFSELGLSTKVVTDIRKDEQPTSGSPVTAWPTFKPSVPLPTPYVDSPAPPAQNEDDWGDFEDLAPANKAASTNAGIEAEARAWDAADRVTHNPPSQNLPPPSNIPPPSILLTLFPPLFNLPQTSLFKTLSTQPFPTKNRILSDPSTISFLRAYLLIATVAAHIIAGRKLRWKRDVLLSQSMKIGPAAPGGKSGMKLTGVDKAEVTKEDREATDVIQVWREHLGRLRSAVAVANSSMSDTAAHLVIPAIGENMPVQTQSGALTALKPCVVCGLKREERVKMVDVEAEDSFGEWWVEFWGHRACRNFWLEHEGKLKYH